MVVGCIYRHPCKQQSEFNNEYLKPLSEKIISDYYLVISILIFLNVTQIKMFLTFLTSYTPLILFTTLLLLLD